jgi:hypothetical protein
MIHSFLYYLEKKKGNYNDTSYINLKKKFLFIFNGKLNMQLKFHFIHSRIQT